MHLYLNILANLILREYFVNTRCLLIFSDNNDFSYDGDLPTVNILLTNGSFNSKQMLNYHGCQGIVMHSNTPVTSFVFLEYIMKHGMDRFNFRRYLFLPVDNQIENFIKIFETFEIAYVADLLIVEPELLQSDIWAIHQNVKFRLSTHKFYSANTTEIVVLDEWNSANMSFLHNNDLYPDKFCNGFGREWKIATFSYKPYSVPASNEGIELQLAIEFSSKFNLTPVLVVDEAGEWGEIYDNWTGYGLLGNIMYDNADVGLGGMCTWAHEYLFLDLSKPIVRTGITCLTPAPQLAGGMLVPFFSFTHEMWIAVGVSFFISSLALFFVDVFKLRAKHYQNVLTYRSYLSNGELLQESIMYTAEIFLLQSLTISKRIQHSSAKYLYGCMFLFSVLVANSYSSGLASSMTIPRYVGAIKTVQELIDSEIQWGATSISWIMSIMDAPEHKYIVLIERFVKADGEHLRKYNNKRFAFSVERLPAGQFAIGDYITEEGVSALRLMSEDLYWEHCVLMTKKSSIWMPLLDDFILRIVATGIPIVWEHRVATTHLNPKIQNAVKYSSHNEQTDNEPIKLRWKHVEGAFNIWLIGTGVSIICFILELIFYKIKIKKSKHCKHSWIYFD